jgi:hypothetical protein
MISKLIELIPARTTRHDTIEKAAIPEAVKERKGLRVDPFQVLTALTYKDKPSSISYDILRAMAARDVVVSAIIQTRIAQVSSLWRPSTQDAYGRGWTIRTRDPKKKLTPAEEKFVRWMEMFILKCGYTENKQRDNFLTFLKKIIRDRLVLDQVAVEIVRNRKGLPAEFYALDGATIRLVVDKDGNITGYKQVVFGQPRVEFDLDELVFAVANPRSDLRVNGYGFSELEMLMHVITSHLYAEEYNRRFFSHGAIPTGLLVSKGAEITQEQLYFFQRVWESTLAGVVASHRIPVLSVPAGGSVEWIELMKSNKDMEWGRWIDYLINCACAVYLIDPAEVNFPPRGEGRPLFEKGQEAKLVYSKDKGLRPLLNFIESIITENFVWPYSEDFVFEFEGIDVLEEERQAELIDRETRVYKTINEVRLEMDLPPLPYGDIIRDSHYMQLMMFGGMAGVTPTKGERLNESEPDTLKKGITCKPEDKKEIVIEL